LTLHHQELFDLTLLIDAGIDRQLFARGLECDEPFKISTSLATDSRGDARVGRSETK
jgi:hypothetical protein